MVESSALLLHRVARGDPQAMQDCIDRYSGLVWSLAVRLSPSRADAEDAVQEIFVSLWRSAQRFDGQRASEPTFIAMIARRRLIDRQRSLSARAEGARPASGVDLDEVPSQAHHHLENALEAKLAARMLGRLPEERQQILRMSIYEGMTHQQISKAMNIPLGTVKSHVRRGLATLREGLREETSRESSQHS